MVVGKGSNGTVSEYPTNKFNRIMVAGKRTNIGRKIIGGSIRTGKIRAGKIRVRKIRAGKIRVRKIRAAMIRAVVTMTAETADRER